MRLIYFLAKTLAYASCFPKPNAIENWLEVRKVYIIYTRDMVICRKSSQKPVDENSANWTHQNPFRSVSKAKHAQNFPFLRYRLHRSAILGSKIARHFSART